MVLNQKLRLKFVSRFSHGDLSWVFLPIWKIFVQLVFPKELEIHQFCEKVSLFPPLLQSHEPRALPIEVSHPSPTDSYVLTFFGIRELHYL